MDASIYSLCPDGRNSDDYHDHIAAFADAWLAQAGRVAGPVIDDFRAFRRAAGQPERALADDAFELLVVGVLLREHGDEAARAPGWSLALLAGLVAWQERWPALKEAIKALRGLAGGLAWGNSTHTPAEPLPAELAVARLRRWLHSQGWTTQAERIGGWQAYLAAIGPDRAGQVIAQARALAEDFARDSAASLDRYTVGVDAYRAAMAGQVRFRYDAGLVMRTRLEYHLGMLGTELLNRAYRDRFLAAPVKIVIAPPCLRARPDNTAPGLACQAVQTPLGAKCQGCRPDCRLHQLTKFGEKHGFAVHSIPDDDLRKVCLASGQAGGRLGVVGLSCVLNNWNAGWEADRLELPAQGLLLDYAGCARHWCRPARPTDTNFHKLQELIGLASWGVEKHL